MKAIVIYKSRTGFVKKYAEWIAGDLSADIFDVFGARPGMLNAYDVVIYGGGVRALGINGIKFIKNNLKSLKGKKVIIFMTGASPFKKENLEQIKNANFTAEEQEGIKFFYLRGGFDFRKLGFIDKTLMILLKWVLKSKKDLTADERGLLEAYDNPVDFTDKANARELIEYAKS